MPSVFKMRESFRTKVASPSAFVVLSIVFGVYNIVFWVNFVIRVVVVPATWPKTRKRTMTKTFVNEVKFAIMSHQFFNAIRKEK
jgi:hypothetical protein